MTIDSHYLYWAVNICSVAGPVFLSFDHRISFAKEWKAIFFGIFGMSVLFIIWDVWFTHIGVWGFSEIYTVPFRFFGLPLEEIFFFACIPYACLFSHEVVRYYWPSDKPTEGIRAIALIAGLLLCVFGLFFYNRWYTLFAFLGAGLYLMAIRKSSFLTAFLKSYLLTLLPFLIVNGILTGSITDEPVVWYNNSENLSVRFGTIPVEDFFYGLLMNGLVVLGFEKMRLAR